MKIKDNNLLYIMYKYLYINFSMYSIDLYHTLYIAGYISPGLIYTPALFPWIYTMCSIYT